MAGNMVSASFYSFIKNKKSLAKNALFRRSRFQCNYYDISYTSEEKMLAKICALAGLAVASAFAPAALPGRVTSRGDIRVLYLKKIAPTQFRSCRFAILDCMK
jgi:hypothetical protein